MRREKINVPHQTLSSADGSVVCCQLEPRRPCSFVISLTCVDFVVSLIAHYPVLAKLLLAAQCGGILNPNETPPFLTYSLHVHLQLRLLLFNTVFLLELF